MEPTVQVQEHSLDNFSFQIPHIRGDQKNDFRNVAVVQD